MNPKILKRLEEIAYGLLDHRGTIRCFHCAFIFRKNKILSIGLNSEKSHTLTKKFAYHKLAKCHAELKAAIRGGLDDYSDYNLAVLRIDRNNNLNNSKCCSGCFSMAKQLNFKNIYYTDKNGSWNNLPKDIKIINKPDRF